MTDTTPHDLITRPTKSSRFACRPEQYGNYIAWDEASKKGFILNKSSYRIWELCDGTKDIQAIAADLTNEYSTDIPADVQEIVSKHIAILTAVGLLQKPQSAN